jgi:hypothetical protein
MPALPLIWLGAGAIGYFVLREADNTVTATTGLVKWVAVAGGVYVAARALKVI